MLQTENICALYSLRSVTEYSKIDKRLFQAIRFGKYRKHIKFRGKVCWKLSNWKELLQ
jgi:hypothetical protein